MVVCLPAEGDRTWYRNHALMHFIFTGDDHSFDWPNYAYVGVSKINKQTAVIQKNTVLPPN
jgi:hypothetical protein